MDVLRGHPTVQSLVRRPHRTRAALFLMLCTLAAAGGGFAWARADDLQDAGAAIAVEAAAPQAEGSSDAVAGAARQTRALRTSSPAAVTEEASFAAVAPDIQAAFRSVAQAAGSRYSFAPTELPTDCRVVPRATPEGDPGEAGQGGRSVVLAAGRGYLAFYDAMAGDLENLPSTECGSVEGHAATVYRVLGGDLVQWEVDGVPHGVFGWGLPRTVVLRVAAGMRRVSADAREHLSEPRDLLNSRSRSGGMVLESVHD